MAEKFNREVYFAHLIQGNRKAAMQYLEQFSDCAPLLSRHKSLFRDRPATGSSLADRCIFAYSRYYYDMFCLEKGAADAEAALLTRILALFPGKAATSVGEAEQLLIAPGLSEQGLFFLGGRTAGRFGPYIWQETKAVEYDVELPDGTARFPVRFLSGFLSKSWLDYISLGELSSGGWTDGDGVICCIRDSYDTESENFRISLLKHEAQHVQDLAQFPGISSENLEYRAKLVELIYSCDRLLLPEFLLQGDESDPSNGHAMAAARLKREFSALSTPVDSISSVQETARKLFHKSTEELHA